MDLVPQLRAQRAINNLVPLHHPLAGKLPRNDHRFAVMAIAGDRRAPGKPYSIICLISSGRINSAALNQLCGQMQLLQGTV
jgi:hypothetical protein